MLTLARCIHHEKSAPGSCVFIGQPLHPAARVPDMPAPGLVSYGPIVATRRACMLKQERVRECHQAKVVADDIGSWVYDDKAYLFRIEPGTNLSIPLFPLKLSMQWGTGVLYKMP